MSKSEKIEKEIKSEEKPCFKSDVKKAVKPDKKLIICGVSAFAAVVILLVVMLFKSNGEVPCTEKTPVVLREVNCFVKDNALYCVDSLSDGEEILLNEGYTDEEALWVGYNMTVSADNSAVYYPTEISEDDIYTLNCYDFDAEENKRNIAQGVSEYYVSADGSVFYYLDSDKQLCDSDGSVIAQESFNCKVSPDGSRIVYNDAEGKVYLKQSDKATVSVSDKNSIAHPADDFSSVIVYGYGGKIQRVYFDGKTEVITEKADYKKIYDSGEVYFIEFDKETLYSFSAVYQLYSVYYNNGGENKLITDEGVYFINYGEGEYDFSFASEKAAMVYRGVNKDFTVDEKTEYNQLCENMSFYRVISSGESECICADDIYSEYSLTDDGLQVYCRKITETENEKGEDIIVCDLYTFDGNEIKLLAEDYGENREFVGVGNGVWTQKETEEGNEFFLDGKLIIENVESYGFTKDFSVAWFVKKEDNALKIYMYSQEGLTTVTENGEEYFFSKEGDGSFIYTVSSNEKEREIFRIDSQGNNKVLVSGNVRYIVAYM